jgi:hypothetical protein
MPAVLSTPAHHPFPGEDELDGAGSLLDEAPMEVNEPLQPPGPAVMEVDTPAQPSDGDGGQGRDSFRADLFEDLRNFEPLAVRARVVSTLHANHGDCTTLGDFDYADAVSLGLLERLWDEVGLIYNRDALIIENFGPYAFHHLKEDLHVTKYHAFALVVADALGVAATWKSQGLKKLGDALRSQKVRLRETADAELRKLPADTSERVREAAEERLKKELRYDVDLAFRINSTSGRYSASVSERAQLKPLGEYNSQLEQKAQLKSVTAALASSTEKLAQSKQAARRDSKRAHDAEQKAAAVQREAAAAAAAAERAATKAEAARAAEQRRAEAAAASAASEQAKLAKRLKRLAEQLAARKAAFIALARREKAADAAARAAVAASAQSSKDAAKAAKKQQSAEKLACELQAIKLKLQEQSNQNLETARQAQTSLRIISKQKAVSQKDDLNELRVRLTATANLLAETLAETEQLDTEKAKLEAENAKLAKLTRAAAGPEIARLEAANRKLESQLGSARGAARHLGREVRDLAAELRRSRAATDAETGKVKQLGEQLSERPVSAAALLDELEPERAAELERLRAELAAERTARAAAERELARLRSPRLRRAAGPDPRIQLGSNALLL